MVSSSNEHRMRPSLSTSVSSAGAGSRLRMMVGYTDATAMAAFRRVSVYQRAQISSLALAFLFCTSAGLTLSYLNFVLQPECILFSSWEGEIIPAQSVAFSDKVDSSYYLKSENETLQIAKSRFFSGKQRGSVDLGKDVLDIGANNEKASKTRWGKKKNCYVTQYGYASAAACSFILCWFFVFFRPTKEAYLFKKQTAASKLIIPGILFSLAFTITVFVAAITMEMGISSWCNNIYDKSGKRLFDSCSSVQNFALRWHPESVGTSYVNYYALAVASEVLGWFGAFAWLASVVILSVRCFFHVDFPDYFFDHSILNNDGFRDSEDPEQP